jgi:hypothetical protein
LKKNRQIKQKEKNKHFAQFQILEKHNKKQNQYIVITLPKNIFTNGGRSLKACWGIKVFGVCKVNLG